MADTGGTNQKVAGRVTSFSVEPFNGYNDFTLWQQRVKNILTREGLVKALNKKTEKPEKLSTEAWQDMRDLANSTIQLFLADNTLREVIGLDDPAEVWEKLMSRYKSKSLTNRLFLKKKLYGLKMEEGTQLAVHLDEFNRILTEVLALDVKIEEEDKALLLLASLPTSYDHIVTTLLFGKDTLKIDEVIASLLMNESRKSNGDHASGESRLLAADGGRGRSEDRQGSRENRGRSKSRAPRKCYYCDEEGHIKRNCPVRKEDMKLREKGKEKVESSTAGVLQGDSDEEVILCTTSAGEGDSGWILDSGSFVHACSVREHFSTYQTCASGTVQLPDGSECRVAGVGSVQFRMSDGSVRILTEVRHVPDLKRNLVSLGVLASRGYLCTLEGGALRVCRGARVVLRGQMMGGVYRLVGRVDTGVARAGVSQASSTNQQRTCSADGGAWRKRVTFASDVDGGRGLSCRLREVEPHQDVQQC